MPRRSDPLESLRVNTPCTADWDSMVGNDQIRFCAHCNLNVHNLSSMTRADARRLVRRFKGSLCVRYHRLPDGSPRTLAPPARLHQIARRASKLAAGTFGAVLAFGAGASAQQGPRADAGAQGVVEFVARDGASLTGTIFDADGAAIPNASVTALNVETLHAEAAVADGEGVYRFEHLRPGTYSLTAAAPGFVAGEVHNVELARGVERRQDATLAVQGPEEVLEVTANGQVETVVSGGAMIVEPKDPLVKAASVNDLKAVMELLAVGVDVNVVDEGRDTTALMEAVVYGNAEMVRALLGAGADVNLRDRTKRTALMSLGEDASADLARTLLSAGARVNQRDESGNTALIEAAGFANEEVLRVLLEAGAKVNAKNVEGQTALMWAARMGNLENVRALLLAGADLSGKDAEGKTALKWARDAGHEEVAGLLVAFGAVEE